MNGKVRGVKTLNVHQCRRKDKLSAVIGIALIAILTPILIVNLTVIIKSYVYPDRVPDFLGNKPFIVLSGSMEPVFSPGDLVIVREVPPQSLKKGDIIAFRQDGAVITHRIVGAEDVGGQRMYITKGDSNNAEDRGAVSIDRIEGRYICAIAGLGSVALYMQTGAGILLFVVLPLLFFMVYDGLRRRKNGREERRHADAMEREVVRMKKQLEEKSAGGEPSAE